MASLRVDSISILAESIFVESAGESKIASKSFSSISLRRFCASIYSSTSSRIKGGTDGILRTQIFVLFKRDILLKLIVNTSIEILILIYLNFIGSFIGGPLESSSGHKRGKSALLIGWSSPFKYSSSFSWSANN